MKRHVTVCFIAAVLIATPALANTHAGRSQPDRTTDTDNNVLPPCCTVPLVPLIPLPETELHDMHQPHSEGPTPIALSAYGLRVSGERAEPADGVGFVFSFILLVICKA